MRLKALEEYTTQKTAAFEILALNKPITALIVKELKALVHYKKINDDRAVPNANYYILERYEVIYFRVDQTLETYLSSLGHPKICIINSYYRI